MTSDVSVLEKSWNRARELALKFLPAEKVDDIARVLGMAYIRNLCFFKSKNYEINFLMHCLSQHCKETGKRN